MEIPIDFYVFFYIFNIKDLLMYILKKLMVFILVFSILIVLKEIFSFIIAYRNNKTLDKSVSKQIILATAISYIFTIIFTGFKLF